MVAGLLLSHVILFARGLAHAIPKHRNLVMKPNLDARPSTNGITLTAGIAALAGPTCAFLFQRAGGEGSFGGLTDVWVMAAIGAIGVGIGVFAFWKGSKDNKVAGIVCFLANAPVLGIYGFIGLISTLFVMGDKWKW